MIELEKSPPWIKSLIYSLSSTQQFILYGNIYDFYLCYDTDYGYLTFSLTDFLAKHLHHIGYNNILSFEPLKGFSLLYGDKNFLENFGFSFNESSDYLRVENLNSAYLLLEKLMSSKDTTSAVIFNFASFLKELSTYKNDYTDFLFKTFRYSLDSTPINENNKYLYNQILFLFKDMINIPEWYHNPKIRYIKIPKPDIEIRKKIINSVISSFDNYKDNANKEKITQILASITEGMYAKQLLNLLLEARKIKPDNIIEFIQIRKLNTIDNPWKSVKLEELEQSLKDFNLIFEKSIIKKISNIIKTAYFNFSNIDKDINRPRSFMLFHGYHKYEQTNLAQVLAKIIFKDQDSFLKIDINEYLEEADITKLLNNLLSHISNFPYGIILFQDIQKANKKVLQLIFDIIKYGKTAIYDNNLYFHNYIIILTYSKSCNLSKKTDITDKEIKNLFESTDNYELYLEIKNNIINFPPFNVDKAINYLKNMLKKTIEKIKVVQKVSIVIEENVKDHILSQCLKDKTQFCSVELKSDFHNIFISALTDLFIEMNIKEGDVILIKDLKGSKFEAEFV